MSKKNLMPLLITGGVLLVAVIAVLIVLSIPVEETPEPEPLEVQFINEDTDGVKRLAVTPRNSPYYEITVTKPIDGSEAVLNVVPGVEGFSYDHSSLTFFLSIFSGLKSTAVVVDEATEAQLETWGLSNPLARIAGTYENGDTVTLLVGDPTATADGYYAMLEGEKKVYIISTGFGEKLTSDEWDLRDMAYLPYDANEDSPYDLVKEVSLYRDGEKVFDLHYRTQEELDAIGPGASIYALLMPESYETNANLVETQLLGPMLTALTFSGIVGDDVGDLSSYGITDTSAKLEVTDQEGGTYTVLYGTPQEDGNTYAFRPDTGTLYTTSADLSFLQLKPMDLISDILWLHAVSKVDSVDFTIRGERHKLTMKHGVNEDGDSTVEDAVYDGKSIGSSNGRRLYGRILSLFAVGEIPEGRTWSEAEFSYTLNFLDGTSSTLELCPLNDRQFAMVLDGQASFYIGIRDIEYMLEALEYVEAGEEIPME